METKELYTPGCRPHLDNPAERHHVGRSLKFHAIPDGSRRKVQGVLQYRRPKDTGWFGKNDILQDLEKKCARETMKMPEKNRSSDWSPAAE